MVRDKVVLDKLEIISVCWSVSCIGYIFCDMKLFYISMFMKSTKISNVKVAFV